VSRLHVDGSGTVYPASLLEWSGFVLIACASFALKAALVEWLAGLLSAEVVEGTGPGRLSAGVDRHRS
jgi:hypothetical protein